MAKFFVGQRVKKVRGKTGVGAIGTIIKIDPDCIIGLTLLIRFDNPMYVTRVLTGERIFSLEGWGQPQDWEPILGAHEPCESEFKESLDKLLETSHV